MSADLKQTSRLFFESMNRADLDTIENQILAPGVVVHFPAAPAPLDLKAFRHMGEAYLAAFPGCKFTITNQLVDGDTVVTQNLFEGVQTGELMGIPPTGRRVQTPGVTIDRYGPDGKVIERWESFDMLGMLVQLGVIPMPNQA